LHDTLAACLGDRSAVCGSRGRSKRVLLKEAKKTLKQIIKKTLKIFKKRKHHKKNNTKQKH